MRQRPCVPGRRGGRAPGGYISTYHSYLRTGKKKGIATDIVIHGLENLMAQFRSWVMYQDQFTWSICNYFLGSDRRTFNNVCLKNSRYYSNHLMVLGVIRGAQEGKNGNFFVEWQNFLL